MIVILVLHPAQDLMRLVAVALLLDTGCAEGLDGSGGHVAVLLVEKACRARASA